MSLAEIIMTAWDKTMETGDAKHLSYFFLMTSYLSTM